MGLHCYFLRLSVLGLCLGSVLGFLLDDNTVTGLLAALRQEKEARALLETDIQTLRNDLEYVNSRHQAGKGC